MSIKLGHHANCYRNVKYNKLAWPNLRGYYVCTSKVQTQHGVFKYTLRLKSDETLLWKENM